jgi:hypothetical protein
MTRFAKASLLLCFFCVCAAALVRSHWTRELLPPPIPRELFSVVNAQLRAVRSDDFRSAYRHAASGVQQQLSLPQFERRAREDYKPIAEAHRVEFGDVTAEGGQAIVQVFFFAADGSVRAFAYRMVQENEVWKISGVQELGQRLPHKRLSGLHI